MRSILLTLLPLLASLTSVFAYTIETGFITRTQPNGIEFKGRGWGDDIVATSITKEGYIYVQERDRYFYYAKLDDTGEFVASQFRVGCVVVINGIVVSAYFGENYHPFRF